MHEELLTDFWEFPRCCRCRSREAHRSEMVDLTQEVTTEELRPLQAVFACKECV